MKHCPECKHKLAENAKTCPKCGYSYPNKGAGALLLIITVILFISFPFVPGTMLSVMFFLGSIILAIIGGIKIQDG